jgi:hypothetical protein
LIDATPVEPAPHDLSPKYHKIPGKARMSEPPWPPGSYAEAHAKERAKVEAEPAATMIDIGDLDREDLACAGLRRADRVDFFREIAAECFAVSRFCPSEADIGHEYLAAAEAALEGTGEADQSPTEQPVSTTKRARRQRKPRPPKPPTLASVAKQASKAGIEVGRYEVKPDGSIIIVTGKPERVETEDPWPLDEFRTKETKQ